MKNLPPAGSFIAARHISRLTYKPAVGTLFNNYLSTKVLFIN